MLRYHPNQGLLSLKNEGEVISPFVRSADFELAWDDIALIGIKYGIDFDDDAYCLVFQMRNGKRYVVADGYLDAESLAGIEAKLGYAVIPEMSNEAYYAQFDEGRSSVIYPEKFRDRPLFQYRRCSIWKFLCGILKATSFCARHAAISKELMEALGR